MVKKSAVDYIKRQLQKGYGISAIKEVMLKYGYNERDIDAAISEVYHPTIRHEIHLSRTTLFALMFILASVIGTVFFFYYNPPEAPAKLLDLSLEPVATTAEAGESITFLKELSNLGSSKRYDVVVKQEIIDPKTFKAVTEKTETRAIETFGSTQTDMAIPQGTSPGDYILRVIVEYGNKKAVATLPVKVIAGKKDADESPPESQEDLMCGDNDPCTEDIEEGGECINKPIVPCCGNNICEEQERETCIDDCKEKTAQAEPTLEEIKEISKSNPGKAITECEKIDVPDLKDTCIGSVAEVQRNKAYCSQISNARIRDSCYLNIANSMGDNSICEDILASSRKDSCYMNFVLENKDYSVCGKLNNSALRSSCDSLRQLYEINKEQQTK